MHNVTFVAEVKTKSPFGYISQKSWDELFALAEKYGDIISIHTDERWGGSFDLLKKARNLTEKPLLAKGIHTHDDDVRRAVDAGADYILVVGRIPNVHHEKCLIEPHTLSQLQTIPKEYKVVWNSRELETGERKRETWEEARALRNGWMCQASNIKAVEDVKKDADAILVGTHLEEFVASLH